VPARPLTRRVRNSRLGLGIESERNGHCRRERYALRAFAQGRPTATRRRTNGRFRCGRSPNGGFEHPLPSDERLLAESMQGEQPGLSCFFFSPSCILFAPVAYTSQSHTHRGRSAGSVVPAVPFGASVLPSKVSNGMVAGLVPEKPAHHTHHRARVGVSLTPLGYGLPPS
jgi:hypothetical protein